MSSYRCIFIDWHNTLSTSLFWGHLMAGAPAQRHLYARLRASLYGRAGGYGPVGGELVVPWMRGIVTTEVVMRAVAEDTGLSFDLVLTEFIAGCRQMALISPAIPALVGALRERGCRVVIATDNMDCFLRWTAPSLRLAEAFDAILSSAAIGGFKADRDELGESRFFQRVLREYGLAPSESVLLDDSAGIAETMRGFGIDYWPITAERGVVAALQQLLEAG